MMYIYKKLVLLVVFLPLTIFALTINVKDYGAKGNGKTDDTRAFQNAVDVLKRNKGGTLTVPKGNYPISFLKFFGQEYSNISIVGNNANILQLITGNRKSVVNNKFKTFAQRYAADGCFVFDAQVSQQKNDTNSIKNIKISGLNFISDVEKHGFDELLHHISAHGVSNFIVENCTFTGFLGDGIAINGGTDFTKFHDAYNKDVIIRNCKFDGINRDNRQGISIYYSDGFKIENCDFKNITRDDMPGAIDIEPDRKGVVLRNGFITNCKFTNIGGMGAIVVIQQDFIQNKIVTISRCEFTNLKAPLAVVGTKNYLNGCSSNYQIDFINSIINNSKSVADFRFARDVYMLNNEYHNITTETYNNVSAVGVNNVRFENCLFDNISHTDGLTFTGSSNKIDFINCQFVNFRRQAITINDPTGIGTISRNSFKSTQKARSYPLITGRIKRNTIINLRVLERNQSSGNFLPFTITPFYIN